MDFSPEVLIDFGFNLAGYAIAALLIYLVLGRRSRKIKTTGSIAEALALKHRHKDRPINNSAERRSPMEFVAFGERPEQAVNDAAETRARIEPENQSRPLSRQESRRAIYREARRLLAKGRSGSELLSSLPLTEDEMEMLSFSRQA